MSKGSPAPFRVSTSTRNVVGSERPAQGHCVRAQNVPTCPCHRCWPASAAVMVGGGPRDRAVYPEKGNRRRPPGMSRLSWRLPHLKTVSSDGTCSLKVERSM
jgi:hypothetical protein